MFWLMWNFIDQLCANIEEMYEVNPLTPNSDLSQIPHSSVEGLSVREVVNIENMIS